MLIGSTAPHAHLVEAGTDERYHKSGKFVGLMPAEPFVLPAFLAKKDAVLSAMKSEIATEYTRRRRGSPRRRRRPHGSQRWDEMGDFAAALKARIEGDAAVSAIVGTKVSWSIVPDRTALPYLRLQAIGGNENEVLAGPNGLKRAFVTVDAFAGTHKAAWALAQVARTALLGTATVSGIAFVRTDAELPRDAGEDIPGVGFVHLVKFNCQIDYRGD